jgi:sugar lactone lactonase YvrE
MKRRLFAEGFGFLESPRWRNDHLWVSDMVGRRVVCLGRDGTEHTSLEFPDRPSGLGWLPDGRLLAVGMNERTVFRLEPSGWAVHADLSHLVSSPLNDMVVAPTGAAYVTGLGYDADTEEPRTTRIILVRPDGSFEVLDGDLWRPNGCVISPDCTTLIVAETRLHRLSAFTIDGDGRLHDQRVHATFPSGSWADGICLDTDGAVWAADPKGQRCFRVRADGDCSDVIDTAPYPCVACTLGGEEQHTLYLLLCPLADFDDTTSRGRARIESFEVDVPAAGSP